MLVAGLDVTDTRLVALVGLSSDSIDDESSSFSFSAGGDTRRGDAAGDGDGPLLSYCMKYNAPASPPMLSSVAPGGVPWGIGGRWDEWKDRLTAVGDEGEAGTPSNENGDVRADGDAITDAPNAEWVAAE